jgi:predicted glycosyltransferase
LEKAFFMLAAVVVRETCYVGGEGRCTNIVHILVQNYQAIDILIIAQEAASMCLSPFWGC